MSTCQYGEKCYRKNPEHIKTYHSGKVNSDKNMEVKKKNGTTKRGRLNQNNERLNSTENPLLEKHSIENQIFNKEGNLREDIHEICRPPTKKSRTVITDPNVDIPEFINHFWEQAKQFNSDHPCYAFHSLNSARLVGVFEYLNGSLSNFSDSPFRLHWRFATDLPEMQTIIVCDGGRYALWRDEPRSNEILIVFASNNEHFPKIEIVGDIMEHVLIHLAGKDKHILKGFLPQGRDIDNLRKQMKAVCARRRKKKLGKAPHDPGIWVKVVNDIGYRPITEDPREIKSTLEVIRNTDNDNLREKKMEKIMEIVTNVQFANDECDFGMGLELGHWLFLANQERLDDLVNRILGTVYKLLGRKEYADILDAQLKPGVRRRKNMSI